MLFTALAGNTQVAQLGSGTTTNTITQASPVNTYYRRQVAQFVYTAAELNAAGISTANTLSQLGFYVTNQPVYSIPGYTIKIKHTNQTNVNSSLGTTGWTTVKNAFTYTPNPGGYDMIVFDVPFNWNGTQNIGVEICWSQIQPTWDASGQCRIYTATRGYRYSRDDNTGSICGNTPGTRVNYKPQAQLVFKTTATWNGSSDNDWFNDANWDIGAPDSELHALIPSGPTNMPVITGAGAECKNLQVDNGASLTISGSNNIDIYGNWTNNGTFSANSGTVTLKGDATNNIDGATNQELYNLTIDNVNGAIISGGSINLNGTLDIAIATGNFNTNNALTLISNASGTARIDELTSKCQYTLDMSDSYGDSWNGGYVSVYIDGVHEGDYFAKGSNSTSNFYAAVGSTIRLDYTAGIYEWENSYILYDGGGSAIFTDGPTPSTGTNVFSTTGSCSFFNPISGDITMQRYINAGATDWRFLTSAVSNTTLTDFNDDFITSGFTGSDFPNWPSAANPWPSIYFYDETTAGIQDNGFTAATNITNSVAVGEGLWIWCGDTITGTQPFTIDMTNPPNVGSISLPMSYTNSGAPADDGWNMVGNPYPSTLDWDEPSITKTNINNAIYIWNPDLQQFGSYVAGIGTNGGSNNIASSQAFWVQANAAGPVITVTEASKTSVDGAFLKPAVVQPFRLKATNNYGTDEIVINFDNGASNGFDALFDAEKMSSVNTSLPRVASVMNATEFSINQFPVQEISVPISITCDLAGLQQISVENVHALGNTSCLILEDLFTGAVYDLNSVQSFTAFISDTTSVARFLLHIGAPFDINVTDMSCYGNNDAEIVFAKNTSNVFDVVWKDANNVVIANATNVFADTLSNLTGGTYFIESTDALCGNSVDTVVIAQPSQITSYFTTVSDTINVGDVFTPTNQSVNAVAYEWNFGDGSATSGLFAASHSYNQTGSFWVSLKASQSANCFENYNKLITVIGMSTGIDELTNNDVKTWINNEILNISLNSNDFKQVEIRNALGQIIYSNNIFNDKISVDMSTYSNGIYIIILTNQENVTESFKVSYNQ